MRVDILGCEIDALSLDETVARIAARIAAGTRTWAVPMNASKWVELDRDPALLHAVRGADLVLADGISISAAARLRGHPLPGRVTGCDLMEALLARAPARGWRIYLLGSAHIDAAVTAAGRHYPGLQIVGYRDGYFDDDRAVVDAIRACKPDLLIVGMGTPRQERFLARWLDELDVPFVMGVGGGLDVLSGQARRAPALLRTAGLEWAWRLAAQPRRRFGRAVVRSAIFAARALQGYRLPES